MTDRYDGLSFLYNYFVSPTLLQCSLLANSFLSFHFLYIPHLDTMTVIFFVYVQNHIFGIFDILRMNNLVMCHPNPIMTSPTDGLRS